MKLVTRKDGTLNIEKLFIGLKLTNWKVVINDIELEVKNPVISDQFVLLNLKFVKLKPTLPLKKIQLLAYSISIKKQILISKDEKSSILSSSSAISIDRSIISFLWEDGSLAGLYIVLSFWEILLSSSIISLGTWIETRNINIEISLKAGSSLECIFNERFRDVLPRITHGDSFSDYRAFQAQSGDPLLMKLSGKPELQFSHLTRTFDAPCVLVSIVIWDSLDGSKPLTAITEFCPVIDELCNIDFDPHVNSYNLSLFLSEFKYDIRFIQRGEDCLLSKFTLNRKFNEY